MLLKFDSVLGNINQIRPCQTTCEVVVGDNNKKPSNDNQDSGDIFGIHQKCAFYVQVNVFAQLLILSGFLSCFFFTQFLEQKWVAYLIFASPPTTFSISCSCFIAHLYCLLFSQMHIQSNYYY